MVDTGSVPSSMAARRILVDFCGDGEGTDELSWGQWEIWLAIVGQKSALPIGGTAPLSGVSIEDIAEELCFLMSRFQSMRTRLVFTDDGRPLQSLSAKGQIVLEVFEAGGQDPLAQAKLVHAGYAAKPFDFVNDWPVRMAVVCQDGMPVQQVAVMTHLTTDAQGGLLMVEEITRRVGSPVDGWQSLEQARWQRSPAGARQSEAALRYLARQLDRIPLGMLTAAGGARQPRYWKGKLRSKAMWLAVQALAARTNVDSSAILLALYAIGFARVTGQPVFFTRPVVSNRFRAQLSNVVCFVAQAGLCVIEVSRSTVDEVIGQAQRAAMTAYKYAYFDPQGLTSLIAETAARRGPTFSASCFFNDRRSTTRDQPVLATFEPAETAFYWVPEPGDKICDRLFLNVEDVPGVIDLTVDFDTHYVPPETVEAMLRAMEETAITAAADPALKTGL